MIELFVREGDKIVELMFLVKITVFVSESTRTCYVLVYMISLPLTIIFLLKDNMLAEKTRNMNEGRYFMFWLSCL